jgi:lipopolysaccharide export LptBFGC system permease protein LptF
MRILTRFIMLRFLGNFWLLFALLFVFAVSIDVLVQWEFFVDAATRLLAAAGGTGRAGFLPTIKIVVEFHAPRVFQFYQYMMPLVALGAMGFTSSAMLRHREFVAMLSAGLSMQRITWPFLLGMLVLCGLQLANQEFMLPRLATRLLMKHSELATGAQASWGIPLAADSAGTLIHADRFDPATQSLVGIYAVVRESGVVRSRIEAARGTWSAQRGGWVLEKGTEAATARAEDSPTAARASVIERWPAELLKTDLDPTTLSLRRSMLQAHMLSLRQIRELMDAGTFDQSALRRIGIGRFSSLAIALLVLVISLPFFAMREPRPILGQAVICAGVGLPLLLTAMIFIALPVHAVTPTVGVLMPVIALLPIAAWRFATMKT